MAGGVQDVESDAGEGYDIFGFDGYLGRRRFEGVAGKGGQIQGVIFKHGGICFVDGDFDVGPVLAKKGEAVYMVDVAVGEDGGDGIKLVLLEIVY